jgi:hypothetical protein
LITIKLVGGLGNQLFGYYFGQSLGVPVRYDISDQAHSLGAQKVSITDLDIPGNFGVFRHKFLAIVPDKFTHFKRLLRKLAKIYKLSIRSSQVYFSGTVGFDSTLNFELGNYRYIEGYFQSYLYADSALKRNSDLRKIELVSESSWFKSMKAQLIVTNPIVVHVRRGDYSNLKDTFGILSDQYYFNAIKDLVQRNGINQPIWIFSDELHMVRESMPKVMSLNPLLVDAPVSVSAAESLILMSYANVLVMANSTFSWWAAWLNQGNKLVIAPDKWFRALPDPELLLPPNWERRESLWSD